MQEITPEGQRILADIASRNGVSLDAVVTLLSALVAGNGSQAQFSHPDLGGMGQWSQGGMIMVGDMFNQGLKYRVDTLCNELANLVRNQPLFKHSGASVQSQSQGRDGVSLFVPGSGSPFIGHWWPAELGDPASTGAQNTLRYACFPDARRVAIQQAGQVSVYDTGEHVITGFSQQQSGDQALTFTSQFGLVRLADLPLVSPAETRRQEAYETVGGSPEPSPAATAPAPPSLTPPDVSLVAAPTPTIESAPSAGKVDFISTIERLAELRQKGILTEEEFSMKKSELLSRI
jgi:hypothetical protein